MRPPARVPTLLLTALLAGCGPNPDPQSGRASAAKLEHRIDERPVMIGEVVERLEGADYVYLHLAVGGGVELEMRWVALPPGPTHGPQLGARVRVRSLARRSRVWDPKLERDFATLDYVALVPPG